MKLLAFLFIFIGFNYSFKALSYIQLDRQWSRSTLENPHFGFRYANRMSPVLTNELVIQGNAVDGMKAFHRDSGREVWSFAVQNGVEGGAVLDGDRLYFGAGDGYFYCLNALSGEVFWKFLINSESLARPLIHGSRVFHISGNDTLYSFDKISGRSFWVKTNAAKANMSVRGQATPIYKNGVLYLGFSDGYFSAINAQNGRKLWSRQIGDDKRFNDVDAHVVFSSSCLLVSSFANALYCLDKTSGQTLWKHDYGGYNSVYLGNKKIYYPTAEGEIHILDSDSGKLLEKIKKIKGLATKIISFNNFIVYGESQGALVVREKNSLKEIDRFYSGRGLFANPTVDRKKQEIYFVSNDANLFRLDVGQKRKNPFMWSYNP